MSELKLNLVDSQQILQGAIHGSIADACVAALSAEPENIAELEAALTRYIKPEDQRRVFGSFLSAGEIDTRPWDAGIVIIDLAARVVAAESSYSQPQPEGEVHYYDGTKSTDIAVMYRVSEEWKFSSSIDEYESCRLVRSRERAARPPLDARSVLYGRALLEFIVGSVRESSVCRAGIEKEEHPSCAPSPQTPLPVGEGNRTAPPEEERESALADEISAIHARWLTTCRVDLRGQSPRDVLLAKQDFIDFDLHTRQLQWTFQGEGPPCLGADSFAYRFGGFGTHECVIYYDLVRHLLWSALDSEPLQKTGGSSDLKGNHQPSMYDKLKSLGQAEVARLEQIKNEWLENPQADLDGRIPAIIIDNERKRLPIALSARDMIIDEDCELCVMSANEVAMGYGPGFWHLDGSHMDEGFAFSFYRTRAEWEEETRRREEFDRKWKEREERIARGESVEDEFGLDWIDSDEKESVMPASTGADDEPSNLIQ